MSILKFVSIVLYKSQQKTTAKVCKAEAWTFVCRESPNKDETGLSLPKLVV